MRKKERKKKGARTEAHKARTQGTHAVAQKDRESVTGSEEISELTSSASAISKGGSLGDAWWDEGRHRRSKRKDQLSSVFLRIVEGGTEELSSWHR